jgi:hypothetical protein
MKGHLAASDARHDGRRRTAAPEGWLWSRWRGTGLFLICFPGVFAALSPPARVLSR